MHLDDLAINIQLEYPYSKKQWCTLVGASFLFSLSNLQLPHSIASSMTWLSEIFCLRFFSLSAITTPPRCLIRPQESELINDAKSRLSLSPSNTNSVMMRTDLAHLRWSCRLPMGLSIVVGVSTDEAGWQRSCRLPAVLSVVFGSGVGSKGVRGTFWISFE